MFQKINLFVLATMAASALSTPVIRSTSSATLDPTLIVQVNSATPDIVTGTSNSFVVDDFSGAKTHTLVQFENIPTDAKTCILMTEFQADYIVSTTSGAPGDKSVLVDVVPFIAPISAETTWNTRPNVHIKSGSVDFQEAIGNSFDVSIVPCKDTLAFAFRLNLQTPVNSTVSFLQQSTASGHGAGVFLFYET
jgi:Ubiquitin 3 binding protein But2 C-terminal domain